MNKSHIINALLRRNKGTSYLEIGLLKGETFNRIKCPRKVGVDPCQNFHSFNITHDIYNLTSDDFFKQNTEMFDLIFVDGLHIGDQVEKDIANSLQALNKGGYIVCHDVSPPNEIAQKVPRESDLWTGDCWKTWVRLRSTREDLEMFVVDTNYGCGVIKRGSQWPINVENIDLNWANFSTHRKEWLNLISCKEFKKLTHASQINDAKTNAREPNK